MLQAGRSRVLFPMSLLDLSIARIFSSRTMTLRSAQPLTEMSTRILPLGKGLPAREADNFTAICQPTVWKMWEPRRLTTLWVSTACYRDNFFSQSTVMTFTSISAKFCHLIGLRGPSFPKSLLTRYPLCLIIHTT
jgi:hypothetical protein